MISADSIDNIIAANRQITGQSGEPFGLDRKDLLDDILREVDSYDSVVDKREKIIRKVSCFMGRIVFEQPFKNGNKRTALAVGILFIRTNGFSFSYGSKSQKKELFDLLESTMLRFEGEESIAIKEIEDLLRKKIV